MMIKLRSPFINTIAWLVVICFIHSCHSIQIKKRKYRKGFYIGLNHPVKNDGVYSTETSDLEKKSPICTTNSLALIQNIDSNFLSIHKSQPSEGDNSTSDLAVNKSSVKSESKIEKIPKKLMSKKFRNKNQNLQIKDI